MEKTKSDDNNYASIIRYLERSDKNEMDKKEVVRPAGFEPATTSLEGTCSIQLS
jgi:hypothetical protein